ncbi:MAG: exodeoxyribonuclease V subunit alpha [Actinomycetes bacterium]
MTTAHPPGAARTVRAGVAPAITDLLEQFRQAGVLGSADVHVATTIARAGSETDPAVVLAAALAVRAPRHGHVCLEPATVAATITDDDDPDAAPDATADRAATLAALPWPDPTAWATALTTSGVVGAPGDASEPGAAVLPLVFDGTRLWLERYWRYEHRVAIALRARAATPAGCFPDDATTGAALTAAFGTADPTDRQRAAAHLALTRPLAVIAGGPGTGKTRTVAHTLIAAASLARSAGRELRIGLATPTGKASDRMTAALHAAVQGAGVDPEVAAALGATTAVTLHRLLGGTPRGTFRHGPGDPLPYDLVILDETSMVSLPLMAHLLAALRPTTGLVLVGDPDQLVSIEAGAVLGDIIAPVRDGHADGHVLRNHVVVLDRSYRFGDRADIVGLADAIRTGDADAAVALLRAGGSELTWIEPTDGGALDALADEVGAVARAVVTAARSGDAATALALGADVKVLCATRHGDLGSYRWTERIEHRLGDAVTGAAGGPGGRWYAGRPVIVTRNDPLNRLFNGDTGVYVPTDDGTAGVAFPAADGGVRTVATAQLSDTETWWAMTIHKSQGSEFDRVVVSLPVTASPILTRELLYTAVTRAKRRITVVASESALRAAIARPVERATGLRTALGS